MVYACRPVGPRVTGSCPGYHRRSPLWTCQRPPQRSATGADWACALHGWAEFTARPRLSSKKHQEIHWWYSSKWRFPKLNGGSGDRPTSSQVMDDQPWPNYSIERYWKMHGDLGIRHLKNPAKSGLQDENMLDLWHHQLLSYHRPQLPSSPAQALGELFLQNPQHVDIIRIILRSEPFDFGKVEV